MKGQGQNFIIVWKFYRWIGLGSDRWRLMLLKKLILQFYICMYNFLGFNSKTIPITISVGKDLETDLWVF